MGMPAAVVIGQNTDSQLITTYGPWAFAALVVTSMFGFLTLVVKNQAKANERTDLAFASHAVEREAWRADAARREVALETVVREATGVLVEVKTAVTHCQDRNKH